MKFIKTSLVVVAALFALLSSKNAAAQTVTMTGHSQSQVVLTWVAPVASGTWLGCVAGQPACTFRPFSIAGSCPSTIVGSTGWNQLTDTSSGVTTATDSAPLPNSQGQVSYVVKTVQSGLTSDPSNCVTVTIPNVPSPATNLQGH